MNTSFDLAAAALRRLDEDLTRGVVLPPVDAVIRRADAMNRTTTAATAAVLTVGALGAVTVVAQSVVSGAVPLPIPVALAPASQPALTDPNSAPVVADVLNPGEQLVRLNLGVVAPAGSRSAASGATVLARGVTVRDDQAKSVDVSSSKDNDKNNDNTDNEKNRVNKDNTDNDKNKDNDNDKKKDDKDNGKNKDNNDNKNNDNNDNSGGGSGDNHPDNHPGNHHGSSSGSSGDTTTDGTKTGTTGTTTGTTSTTTGTSSSGTTTSGTTTSGTTTKDTSGTDTTSVNEGRPTLAAQPTSPKVIETPDSAETTTPKTPVQQVRRPSPPTDEQKSPWQEQIQQRQPQQQYFHGPTQIKRDPGGTSGDEPRVVAPVAPRRNGRPTSGSTTSESESGTSATGSGEVPMADSPSPRTRPPS